MKYYISNLRNVATFAVILLHVVANIVANFNKTNFHTWQIANLIDSSLRFCVPIFLMISGVVLLGKDEKLGLFLKKRFSRVAIPFLCWSVFYVFYQTNFNTSDISIIGNFVLVKVFKGATYHFWYIYLILGIYLFLPILNRWIIKASKQELIYFLMIWLCALLIENKILSIFPKIELLYFSKYLGYLVLGFFIDKYVAVSVKSLAFGALLFIGGTAYTAYFTEKYTIMNNSFYPNFYGYLTINVLILSIGVFLLSKNLLNKTNTLFKVLDAHSFGIYLIHVLVLNKVYLYFKAYIYTSDYGLATLYLLLVGIITYIISFVIIYLLAMIKPIRKFIT